VAATVPPGTATPMPAPAPVQLDSRDELDLLAQGIARAIAAARRPDQPGS
jgi:hypothetical protein